MPGSRITRKQEEIYMRSRQTGQSQDVAAAKSGVSVRSGRRIERGERDPVPHTWRTRQDPLAAVWETHLVPLLEQAPDLTGLTLLEYLEDTFPGKYDGRVLRTLQRRVQHWKAVHGPDKAVIFRQQARAWSPRAVRLHTRSVGYHAGRPSVCAPAVSVSAGLQRLALCSGGSGR